MSKNVSQSFKDIWVRKQGKVGRPAVEYKRRYWNGSAYVYEADWRRLSTHDYSSIGNINWRLDFPLLNEVKASNINLRLRNRDFDWLPTNVTTGVFRPDLIAPLGYEPYMTMFRVLFGYDLDDGTTEYATMFTGLAIDFNFDTKAGFAEITVSGKEFLLQAADAQLVSIAFGPEATIPAVGDGVITEFLTTSLGVAYFNKNGITVAATPKAQGSDFQLSNVGQYNTAAKITFAVAPLAGQAVLTSGRKWRATQRIEDLVALLCDQAGIPAAERVISPAVFPGVSGQVVLNTQAQWDAAEKPFTDSKVKPNSICIGYQLDNLNFETGDFTSWTAVNSNAGGGSVSSGVQSTTVRSGTYAARLSVQAPIGPATFEFYAALRAGGLDSFISVLSPVAGWTQGSVTVPVVANNVYQLTFYITDGVGDSVRLTSNQFVAGGGGDGTITFYYRIFSVAGVGGTKYDMIIDDILAHNITAVGEFLTAEIDLLQAPQAWGAMTAFGNLNGGSWSFKTMVASISGGPYDVLVPLDANNVPTSAFKRFLKIYGRFTSNASVTDGPVLDNLTLQFTTTLAALALANFQSDTCYSAIQKLAKLCDYEWGFDGSGVLFFRAKTSNASPVVVFDQSDVISRIVELRMGYDRVINVGQVTYGQYYSQYDSSSAPEASPTSQQRFFSQIMSENYSDFLLAFDVDIASGRAQLIHDNNYRPRRQIRIQGKIIPHVDLSDVIKFSFFDQALQKNNVFGDPLQPYGIAAFGKPTNILARDVSAKIIGMVLDPNACTAEYELQEVLS